MTLGTSSVVVWGVLGLAAFSILVFVLCRLRRRRLRRLAGDEARLLLLPEGTERRNRVRLGLRMTALVFLAVALAQPRWGERWEALESHGLDVMVVLDVSRSMWAQDLKPNRLQHARWGLREWMSQVIGDRLGLVVFAGDAVVLCPLTTDQDAFRMLLDDARPELVARGGTNIRRSLETAIDLLGPAGEADRVIILISDGENHEDDPLALSKTLREKEIRVYAVGVGDPEGTVIPMPEGRPRAGELLRDRNGHVVLTRLDEGVVQGLARETGGAYVRATPSDFGLVRLYREGMSDLRRAPHEIRRRRFLRERFQGFIGASLLFLIIELGGFTGRKKLRRSALRRVGLLVLFLFGPGFAGQARAADARSFMAEGLRAYEEQAWMAAAEAFTEAAARAPDAGLDPASAWFNAGLALRKAGRHAEAADRFEKAADSLGLKAEEPAAHQRGRALEEDAERRYDAQDFSGAKQPLEEALGAYERAIRINPAARYLKRDFEQARQRLDEIEDLIPPAPEPEPEPDREEDPDTDPEAEEPEPEPEPEPGETEEDEPEPAAPEDRDPEPDPGDSVSEVAPDEMTQEDAERILDALREEEAAHREGVRPPAEPRPVEKDW